MKLLPLHHESDADIAYEQDEWQYFYMPRNKSTLPLQLTWFQ